MRSPFWQFARRMLRHRWALAASLVFAAISAGGMGAGLLGIAPILENILVPPATTATGEGDHPGGYPALAELARSLDARIGGRIPDDWIAALPEGRFTAVFWIVVALGVLTMIGASANFLHQ